MRSLKYLTLCLVFLLAAPAFAFTVVGFDGEPFYYKNGSEGVAGGCHLVMKKFCEKEKLQCKFKIATIPLILEMLKEGKADAGCPLGISPSRLKDIAFTDNYFRTRFAYFGVPPTAKTLTSLKDLAEISVGVFSPSRVSESLEKVREESPAKFEIIPEVSNYSTLLRAEKISTVVAYVNQEIGRRWIERTHSPLIEAPLAGEELSYNIGFSRKKYSDEKIKHYLKVLNDIKSDVEIRAAVGKLKLQFWDEVALSPK